MIKNVIFDIGGILFDDSKENLEKLLNKDCSNIYKIAYGKEFKKCLLGQMKVDDFLEKLRNKKEFSDISYISYILKRDNLKETYPLIKNNFEYIKNLKKRGYKLYLLSNIIEDSYFYINNLIDIDSIFKGGIYSYKENLIKPDYNIYNLIVDRFKLDKSETIFFDDKEKNVIAANKMGLKSYVFTSIDDVKKKL